MKLQLNIIFLYPLFLFSPIHRSNQPALYFEKSTANSCAPFKVISILCQGSRRNYRSREIHVKMLLYQSRVHTIRTPSRFWLKSRSRHCHADSGICKTRRYMYIETLLQVDFGRGLKYMYTFILENTAHKLFF